MEPAPQPPVRTLRPFAGLIWAAIFLLVIELALEARATTRGFRATLLGRGPGFTQHDPEVAPVYGPTPDFPFRSRILTSAAARAETTLWLASSSYGEDVYMPPTDLFATRLADALGLPVINASHGGITVDSNRTELERLGPEYEPDIVLLYQMSNDIDRISERLAGGRPAGGTPGAGTTSHAFAPVSPWIQSMTSYRQLKSHVTSRLAQHLPLWDELDAHTPPGSSTPEASFRTEVEAFVDAAKKLGARPILITFATAYGPGEASRIPAEIVRQNLAMNIVLSPLGWTRAVAAFNGVLRDIAAERGLLCIDLAADLRGQPELFRDLWHFTVEGHMRVAELLAAGLADTLEERAP